MQKKKSEIKMKESRIKHLMGIYSYRSRAYINMALDNFNKANMTYRIKECKEVLMIYSFYDAQGKTDAEIASLWVDTHYEKYNRSQPYKLKPVRERRDNQNPETYGINYGSNLSYGNYPRIRVPSKKHKNRYKNFLKLFPQFKEK